MERGSHASSAASIPSYGCEGMLEQRWLVFYFHWLLYGVLEQLPKANFGAWLVLHGSVGYRHPSGFPRTPTLLYLGKTVYARTFETS